MGRRKNSKEQLFRARKNGKGKNGNGGNGNGKKPIAAQRVLFEPLEPRILLSSDLSYAGAAAFDLTLRLDDDGVNPATLRLIDNNTTTAVAEQALSETNSVIVSGSTGADRLVVDLSTPFDLLGGVSFTDTTYMDGDLLEVIGRSESTNTQGDDTVTADEGGGMRYSGVEIVQDSPAPSFNTVVDQLFYLDFDGAFDVTYEGPITIPDVDVPAFQAPDYLQGQEDEIIGSLLDTLDQYFSDTGIAFTIDLSLEEQPNSTIYVGGDGSPFADYGTFVGLSEKIDAGNQDATDIAFVFNDNMLTMSRTADDYAQDLAGYVMHEAGHLLGFEHAYEIEANNPLSAVAFKPYSHIQVAKDVRNDLITDGKLTVAGNEYAVNPLIVEAVRQYASYYYAGSIGPDGFPEMIMGQSVLHSESPGIWVGHILDKAWQAQQDDTYSPEEKLQILAWSYGYATHVSGDIWSHTLVNELTGGPWPEIGDILNFSEEPQYLSSVLRHVLAEGYVNDAIQGYDGNPDRALLPDGDVSDDSTAVQELNAPHRFIYDAMIKNLPDLPGQKEIYLFTMEMPASGDLQDGVITAILRSALQSGIDGTFNDTLDWFDRFIIDDQSSVTTVTPDSGSGADGIWRIQSDYTTLILRETADGKLDVYEKEKSRGAIVDAFLWLRTQLVKVAEELGPTTIDYTIPENEPLKELVDGIIAAGDNLLRGEEIVDKDTVFDGLSDLASRIGEDFKATVAKIVSGEEVTVEELKNLGSAFVGSTAEHLSAYVRYWIHNIDVGLEHWSEFGLALSQTFFDPQSRRDVQNQESQSYGPDVVDPDFTDRRAEQEAGVGLLDILESELEDPDEDGNSFTHNYLIPMLGIPRKIGELSAAAELFVGELQEKVLEPTRELAGPLMQPIDSLMEWITEGIREYIREKIREAIIAYWGVDIDVIEFLTTSPSGKMDLASIKIDETEILLFKPTDHERLDTYLGFAGTDHIAPFDLASYVQEVDINGTTIVVTYHDNALGGLKDNAEIDMDKFAAYANSVTLSKLLLFQETLVGQDPVDGQQPKTISQLLTDLIGQPYDFEIMDLNGDHGGNILTATMPGVVDPYGKRVSVIEKYGLPVFSDLWLNTIDGDHNWRQDSQTSKTELYRYHRSQEQFIHIDWHSLNTGDQVTYVNTGGGNDIGGLQNGNTYYAIKMAEFSFKLAATSEDATEGIALYLDPTVAGTNGHSLQLQGGTQLSIDGHSLNTGDEVTYVNTGSGNDIGGLQNGNMYYVIKVDEFTFKLAATSEDATAGIALYLDPTAAGTSGHGLLSQSSTQLSFDSSDVDPPVISFDPGDVDIPVIDTVTWTFTDLQPGTYKVHADWLTILDITPARNAEYRIYDGDSQTPLATVIIDQRYAPDDLVLGLDAWEDLGKDLPDGVVAITSGVLRVELSDVAAGDVVAGRIRIEPVGNPDGAMIISTQDTGYTETSGVLDDTWVPTADEQLLLDNGKMPQSLRDLFAANGEDPSLFIEEDFNIEQFLFLTDILLVTKLRKQPADLMTQFLRSQFSADALKVVDDPLAPTDQQLAVLVHEMNSILKRVSIYDAVSFEGKSLSAETSDLITQHTQQPLAGEQLIRLNRLLLEDFYRAEIARSLPESFVVSVLEPGAKWLVTNIEKIAPRKSSKVHYTESYLIVKENGTFNIKMAWEDLKYPMGTGNFTLWESDLLRPAFKVLFDDWQNGAQNFPDLGDEATRDPNLDTPPVNLSFGQFPEYQEYVPNLVAPSVADVITVSGHVVLNFGSHHEFQDLSIQGDDVDDILNPDILEIIVDDIALITGFISASNLEGLVIKAGSWISLAEDATISGRQVNVAANHWNASSTGDSADITLEAPNITISDHASILAHVEELSTYNAGNVQLISNESVEQTWDFLGIEGFKWRSSEAVIDIGMGANLTGNDISLTTTATTSKDLTLDQPLSDPTRSVVTGDIDGDGHIDLITGNEGQPERLYLNDGTGKFGSAVDVSTDSYKTTSMVLANVDGDSDLDLVVGTDGQGIILYTYDSVNGVFLAGTVIDSGVYNTTALSAGDVDGDGDVDLVAGNNGQLNRMYLNDGTGAFVGTDIGTIAYQTTSIALANVDGDADLDLVAGTDGQGIILYTYDSVNGVFLAGTVVDTIASTITAVAIGDVNNDTFSDLVVGIDGEPNRLYLNDGTGTFASATIIDTVAYKTKALALGDVDNDSDLDLVVGNSGETSRVYLNDGSGAFGAGKAIANDAYFTTSLALADVDGDTDLDLIAGNDRQASRLYRLEILEGYAGYRYGEDIGVNQEIVTGVDVSETGISTEKAVAVVAESEARVTVGAGARIKASHDIVLDATAIAKAQITTKSSAWGVTYGSSSPTAIITVENGAFLSADNLFQMHATTNNDLNVLTFVPSLGESTNIAVSLGRARSTSRADIDMGAEIVAASADILASNANSFRNTAVAAGFGTSEGDTTGYAITVALGYYASSALASVSGFITTLGDLNIAARSVNNTNITRTYASVNGNPVGPIATELGNFMNSLPVQSEQIGNTLMKFQSGETQSGYAVALAVVTSDNSASALIGDGAFVTVGGDLTVTSYAQDSFQISAAGSAGEMLGSGLQTAVGGALVYSKVANRSSAFVGWNADVAIAGTLTLDSDAHIISPADSMELVVSMLGFGEWTSSSGLQAYLSTLTDQLKTESDTKLPGYMDFVQDENAIGTSYLYAGGSASTSNSGTTNDSGSLSAGGGINLQYIYNSATAAVATGARINQRETLNSGQHVNIDAYGSFESVNIAGNVSILNYLTNASDTGLGGFFDGIYCQNFSTAYVDDLADVSAGGDISVNAAADNKLTTIVVAGSFAENTGVDGAIAFNRIKNSTLAYLEDRANVSAGHDLSLNADSYLRAITVTPAIASGGNWGVGISASFTDIQDRTQAFIGDSQEPVQPGGYGGATGSVSAGNNLSLAAHSTPELWSIGVAGGFADGGETYNGSGGEMSAGDSESSSGYGLAGSVAFNWLEQNTLAFIRDSVTVFTGNDLTLETSSRPLLVSVAGSLGDGQRVGIGGSYAHNELNRSQRPLLRMPTSRPSVHLERTPSPRTMSLPLPEAGQAAKKP